MGKSREMWHAHLAIRIARGQASHRLEEEPREAVSAHQSESTGCHTRSRARDPPLQEAVTGGFPNSP
jgi:hypothetical protein